MDEQATNPLAPTCPRCGAATGAVTEETPCRYCGAMLVPPAVAPSNELAPAPAKSRAYAVALAIVGVMAATALWMATRTSNAPALPPAPVIALTAASSAPAPKAAAAATASAAPVSDGATLVLRFGGKGDGPGHFKRAGLLAVDGDAHVFVADADPSRVQEFDASGKLVRQYALSTKFDCCIHGLAVDHSHHLYVSFHDVILRFDTADGSTLPPLEPPPPRGLNGQGFESVAVDAFDMLYGLSLGGEGAVGTVVKLDKTGRVVDRRAVKADARSGSLRGDKLAFDGAGTVFFSHRRGFIEVLDPKWNLQNRIGQEGSGPGELPHFGAEALAPDGHGHLLVLGGDRISVFDVGGRYRRDVLDASKGAKRLRYFQIGMDGRLYATTADEEVAVYTLDLALDEK